MREICLLRIRRSCGRGTDGQVGNLAITYTVIGEVTETPVFEYKNISIPVEEAIRAWTGTLERVFKTVSGIETQDLKTEPAQECWNKGNVYVCRNQVAKPKVIHSCIPRYQLRVRQYKGI